MSANGTPWGMCEAVGCPLNGTVGHGGKWFCFCHANAGAGRREAITAALTRCEWLVNATLDVRRFYGTADWETVRAGVDRLLADNKRRDLLMGNADFGSTTAWLARLERALLEVVGGAGTQQPIPSAPVTGPTSAPLHFAETDQ
jgi:hypothetical protein